MATDAFYPPPPASVPPELGQIDFGYRLRVAAMIGGLFVFLLLYLALAVAAGFLVYGLYLIPVPDAGSREVFVVFILKFGGGLSALLIWLYLIKGLFRRHRIDESTYVELDPQQHPALFAFIERVYRDAGAPRPGRVFASPEVNAAVIHSTSLLSLLIPPRKDLLIGLGLVNVVTLAEFKATLAHEFGHFAQRSTRLGSYLYVANRVMHDLIYRRDRLDRFVLVWSQLPWQIAFPAWGLRAGLWSTRKVLGGLYQGLNLAFLSLSRQSEFNADDVAVRLAGSDALIHGLARLAFAQECFVDAAESLQAAADHGLLTDDLSLHQSRAAERLRRQRGNPLLGLPPELPENPSHFVQVFEPKPGDRPERYNSHPADYQREKNAKRFYLRSPRDDRSPWILFGDATALKRAVAARFYRAILHRPEEYRPQPAAMVQEFIDTEHAETTYDPKYHGLYDDRFLDPGEIQDLFEEPWTRKELAAWFSRWPAADLKPQVEAFRQQQEEYSLLQGLESGQLKIADKTFTFRGQKYTNRDVKRLLPMVDGELNASNEALHRLDREVFMAHWSLAHYIDAADKRGGKQAELLERYRFHMRVQELVRTMLQAEAKLERIIKILIEHRELPQQDIVQLRAALVDLEVTLKDVLHKSGSISTPELGNVLSGSSLFALIVDRSDTKLVEPSASGISGDWVASLAARHGGVLGRLRRAHFKSLGALLAFQEAMADRVRIARPTSDDSAAPAAAAHPPASEPAAVPIAATPTFATSVTARPVMTTPATVAPRAAAVQEAASGGATDSAARKAARTGREKVAESAAAQAQPARLRLPDPPPRRRTNEDR